MKIKLTALCSMFMLRSKVLFTLVFIFFFPLAAYVPGESPPDAVMVGDETCSACHEEISVQFQKNIHSRLSRGDENTCETCHGPGSRHAEEGDPKLIYSSPKDFTITGENFCTNCHRGTSFNSWHGSPHFEVAEGCSNCHKIHGEGENLLTKQEPQLCFTCHSDKMAKAMMPSHHPVMEGLMNCTDCHSVHSGEVKYTVGDDSRELCLSCHADYQGPFVFEHDPVNEDCGICHSPHGTIAGKLLIQNEPFLCLSCHSMHFHTTLTAADSVFTNPLHEERQGMSTSDGMKKAFLTKCTQCHSEIHGTDLPSQSISGEGGALTR